MSRFSIALIRLATLALLGSAGSAAYAQQTIDQNKALAGNVSPGDAPGFPITLSVPGHYKLMSNLQVPQGSGGIQITANDVTLDLNGFTVIGPNSCSSVSLGGTVTCLLPFNPGNGIYSGNDIQRTVLRNGRVIGMQGDGIRMRGLSVTVVDMQASMNAGDGIHLRDGQVRHSQVSLNAGNGFSGSDGALIFASNATRNGADGFLGGAVHESITTYNKGFGANARVRGVLAAENATKNFGPQALSMGSNMSGSLPF